MEAYSINQVAQMEGDTSANAAERIRGWEYAVRQAHREHAYAIGTPTAGALVARATEIAGQAIGEGYIKEICERSGYALN